MTDAFTDHAVQFLQEHEPSNQPFFLYLAYNAPHWPLHAFPEDIEKHTGKYKAGWDELREQRYRRQIELGIIAEDLQLAPRAPEVQPWADADKQVQAEFELEMAIYAAMIDRMDRNIGRLVEQISDMGELDNTLIIFMSDNGGCHTTPVFPHLQGTPGGPDSFPCYGFMGSTVSNVPFRKQKQYIHEGGIATPFIAHYPGMINPGMMDAQPGHVMDIMATIVDLCGATYPTEYNGKRIKPMTGISLRPAFEGKELRRKAPLYWEHVGNRGIRIGAWKLVASKPDLEWELYDMQADRSELDDLSSKMPEKRTELIAIYEKWADENGILPWPRP